MNEKSAKPVVVVLRESLLKSIISDLITFAITAGLVLLAEGRSLAWQVTTIGMFVFWMCSEAGLQTYLKKFYSKRELIEWAEALPDDHEGDEA